MGDAFETASGAAAAHFPSTQWSVVREARDSGATLETLCRTYWRPVYAFIQATRRPGDEETRDLTQEFFVRLLEGGVLKRYSPERGSFRAFLKGTVRNMMLERYRNAHTAKQGGAVKFLSLSDGETHPIEERVAAAGITPEQAFDEQWRSTLLDLAVADLRGELVDSGKEIRYRAFERYLLESVQGAPVSHAQVAQELGISPSDVNHHVAAARGRLREKILDRIRETVSDERELSEEVAEFLAE